MSEDTSATAQDQCSVCAPHPDHGRFACRRNGDLCGCPGESRSRASAAKMEPQWAIRAENGTIVHSSEEIAREAIEKGGYTLGSSRIPIVAALTRATPLDEWVKVAPRKSADTADADETSEIGGAWAWHTARGCVYGGVCKMWPQNFHHYPTVPWSDRDRTAPQRTGEYFQGYEPKVDSAGLLTAEEKAQVENLITFGSSMEQAVALVEQILASKVVEVKEPSSSSCGCKHSLVAGCDHDDAKELEPERMEKITEDIFDAMESLGIEDATMTDARYIADNLAHRLQDAFEGEEYLRERCEFLLQAQKDAVQKFADERARRVALERALETLQDELAAVEDELGMLKRTSAPSRTVVPGEPMTMGEQSQIAKAFERDRWAGEWNSLPTAIDRLLADRGEASVRADFSAFQKRLHDGEKFAGWDPDNANTLAEEVAHLHEEVSEIFRAHRLKKYEMTFDESGKPQGVPAECADVAIGLFYIGERFGFDLFDAIETKHGYNLGRSYSDEGRRLHEPGQ